MRLVVPMRMLGQVDYDAAVVWLGQLHAVMRPGAQLVVEGVDRDRAQALVRAGDRGAVEARRAEVLARAGSGVPGWLASERVVVSLLEAAGWRWARPLEVEEPWAFRVSATR